MHILANIFGNFSLFTALAKSPTKFMKIIQTNLIKQSFLEPAKKP